MNLKTYFIVLAGLISTLAVVYAITSPIVGRPPSRWHPVPETSAQSAATRGEWVLLPSNSGTYCLPRGFLGAYEIWRPDSVRLAQLESDLLLILPAIESGPWGHFEAYRGHAPPLLTYRRQYIGVRRLGDPPIIYVNAFLPDKDEDRPGPYHWNWRRRMACVDDGGWGYWHVEYDPTQRRFRGFGFNGSA